MKENETRLVMKSDGFEDTWQCEKCKAVWVYAAGRGDSAEWESCPTCWRNIVYAEEQA